MKMQAIAHQVVPLIKLPPSEFKIISVDPMHFGISVYSKMMDGVPVRHWQKWSVFDFPNDLFGIKDLENAGLLEDYISAVIQPQVSGCAKVAGGPF